MDEVGHVGAGFLLPQGADDVVVLVGEPGRLPRVFGDEFPQVDVASGDGGVDLVGGGVGQVFQVILVRLLRPFQQRLEFRRRGQVVSGPLLR